MNVPPPFPQELWEQTPVEVQAYLRALEARVVALEATVRHLTERLQQDSRTSSRPPSSDPPQATAKRPRREPSGRRPGGQPGHEGQTRALVPTAAVDVVHPVKPERCQRCQHPLHGEDPQPERHQVTEIPLVQPIVTEYQVHRLICPACGAATRAARPAGVPVGGFGPRVQALAALCTGAYHLSKRTTQRVLEDLFGVELGLGTIAHLEQATVQAVALPVAEARGYVQEQPVAYLDETGWREGRARAWLWTAVTAWVTVFVVRPSRGAKVAQELLGQRFWGILVTDRWSAYTWYPPRWRQVCWAHLVRDIEAMIERGGRSAEIGEALRIQARRMFHWWHRVRDGTLGLASFRVYMGPVRREVERLLAAGQTCGVPQTAGMCRKLLTVREALWTFVRVAGVEPTNNAAERAIRPGVLWRKGSFGTHSTEGSRFAEAMMTVVATLKQQHRPVLAYMTAACEAALCGAPAPSLLPPPADLEQLMRPAA
jgi:transposase